MLGKRKKKTIKSIQGFFVNQIFRRILSMKTILTVVGARPQFIKTAMMSKELEKEYKEILVHTGQHYDYNMSDVFFEELGIKTPDYNLGVAGGSHGEMTGRMLIEIEKVLNKEKPDMVLVYGDTNSTTAGALAAVKLGIPVAHIEAGNNRGSLDNPEDVNRIVSDHISVINFACVESAYDNLKKENLGSRSYYVGDSMYDAFIHYSKIARRNNPIDIRTFDNDIVTIPKEYYYMTCHRQENSSKEDNLYQIMSAAQELDAPTLYSVHPRNINLAMNIKKKNEMNNVLLIQPVGYLSSVALINGAKKIITDSGGVQREAFFAEKQCVTVFDYAWWPETLRGGMNRLSKADKKEIITKLQMQIEKDENYHPFGDGQACSKMRTIINDYFVKNG